MWLLLLLPMRNNPSKNKKNKTYIIRLNCTNAISK